MTTATIEDVQELRQKPKFHDLKFAGDVWRCPITGFKVAKDPAKNLEQRERILLSCLGDDEEAAEARAYMLDLCRQSPLLFINLFCWTYRPIEHVEGGKRADIETPYLPFVTWPVQDAVVGELLRSTGLAQFAFDGEGTAFNVCLDKSREMGASWLALALMVWGLLFLPNTTYLVASRKEEEVEKTRQDQTPGSNVVAGDPDTLFWKLDCLLHFLPTWMVPPLIRTIRHIQNVGNGSAIDGESTNADLSRGGRKLIIAIDEAAAVDELRAIEQAAMDACVSLWYISTPKQGAWYSECVMSGRFTVLTLGWWDHPDKGGEGRKWVYDADCGRMVVHGPFRQREKTKRDPRDLAQNVDIDHTSAGRGVFDLGVLVRHKALFSRPPDRVLRFRAKGATPAERRQIVRKRQVKSILVEQSRDPSTSGWHWWGALERCPDTGKMRPIQTHLYGMGIDLSDGTGASNSVSAVIDYTLGQVVGELASAQLSPARFAYECALAAAWIGGERLVLQTHENNGGRGQQFAKVALNLESWLYLDHEQGTLLKTRESKIAAYGFTTNNVSKASALLELREAYHSGALTDPSGRAIDEAKSYIRFDNGSIGPARLEEESADALATHGDRVIARMLAIYGGNRLVQQIPRGIVPKKGSTAEEIMRLTGELEINDADGLEVFDIG